MVLQDFLSLILVSFCSVGEAMLRQQSRYPVLLNHPYGIQSFPNSYGSHSHQRHLSSLHAQRNGIQRLSL